MIIFILFAGFMINSAFAAFGGSAAQGKSKAVRLTTPVVAPARKTSKTSLSASLFGEKVVIVRLSGRDGIQQDVRVQWMNATVCIHPEDGLRYCQFLMVLENGKRVSLPITENEEKRWVTYQGIQYNRWNTEVRTRRGLLEVLRGDGCKTVPVAPRCMPTLA
jgi:hypothetical protein